MKHKIYSAFIILLIGLTVVVTLYISGTLAGVYLGVMAQDLHVSRSLLSINATLRYLIAFCMNLCIDTCIRKIGLKRLIMIGLAASATMLFLFSVAKSLWICYIAGTIGGFGSCFAGVAPMALLVRRWFPNTQGTVLAITSSMTGIAGVFMTPQISHLIDKHGWRFGFRGLVFFIAIIFILELLFLRIPKSSMLDTSADNPRNSYTESEYTNPKISKTNKGNCIKILIAISALFSLGPLCIYNNVAVLLQDIQFSQLFATGVAVSLISFFNILGKFVMGRLCDRKNMGTVLIIWYGLCVAASLYFIFYRSSAIAFAIPGIILIGFMGGIYSLPVPLMTGRLFRTSDEYTKVLGYCTAAAYLSVAFAGFIFHGFYDITGNYLCSLIYVSVLSTICLLLVCYLIKKEIQPS